MRKRQRAFLQEQGIPFRHVFMLQRKNGNPLVLESLGRACPCAARLCIGGDDDRVIGKTINEAIATHCRADGKPRIGTVWRDQT